MEKKVLSHCFLFFCGYASCLDALDATQSLLWLPQDCHIVVLLSAFPAPTSLQLQILYETCQVSAGRVTVCVMLSSVTLHSCIHQSSGWFFLLVVVGCPTLSSHRRTAKFSKQSGLKACIAASRKGTARAARLGQTQVCAKLAAATARHRKLQQCRRFTWQFASKI